MFRGRKDEREGGIRIPSCPNTAGKGIGNLPCWTAPSVAHMLVAFNRTRTSFGRRVSSSTVSTWNGAFNSWTMRAVAVTIFAGIEMVIGFLVGKGGRKIDGKKC